jgi:CheY-like chemotaxis protein
MNLENSSHPFARPEPEDGEEVVDASFAQRHPLRILIADDNHVNRRVLSLLLQRLGYEVETSENGRSCMDSVFRQPFDLLLLDVHMPDITGIECAAQLRRAGQDLQIVAVTSATPADCRKECLAAGMNGFTTKPVRLPELMNVLREAHRARIQGPAPLDGGSPEGSAPPGAESGESHLPHSHQNLPS